MRAFMEFCLTVLSKFVSLLFNFSLGSYSYGDFLVVTLLVSFLVGALVVRFGPRDITSFGQRPPRISHRSDMSDE